MNGPRMKRLAFLFALLTATPAAAQNMCGVALVLAMDVSRSVSAIEYRLQMDGLANAFRDEEVLAAIRANPGGVAATVMIWGDRRQQKQTTEWTLLTGQGAGEAAFADEITATKRIFGFTLTGLGAAMMYANRLLETNPYQCRRKVIDVSGDGVWNDGPRPADAWAELPKDVTVNGLVILGATPDPLPYYREQVIGGPGSFVEVADDFEDYAKAIKLKLLRELAPSLSMVTE